MVDVNSACERSAATRDPTKVSPISPPDASDLASGIEHNEARRDGEEPDRAHAPLALRRAGALHIRQFCVTRIG